MSTILDCFRVALYARYSSDLQNAASIDDQLRDCRAFVERQGWTVVTEYHDRALSGASLLRPGLQRLLTDSRRDSFDVVVTEALDRLSRDQEDIAGIFKRLKFEGIRLTTLGEGDISELHVGLKGTMNALFLKDLATKTRRGLEGRVKKGKSAGGITFGYDVVPADEEGRGGRTVNRQRATVVTRIFRDFAKGVSPIAIARQLNKEGVAGPGGRPWLDTTIRGHALRGTGILRNELYVGKLIWNRLNYQKDPDTRRRLSRLNPKSQWVVEDVPHLRIVDQHLWEQVAARLEAVRSSDSNVKRRSSAFWSRPRPKHLTTGLIICGSCRKPIAALGKDYLGCNYARRRGTCENRLIIRRDQIEALVLEGLKSQLMAPDLVREFIEAFHTEVNSRRGDQVAERQAMERELPTLLTKIRSLIDMIAGGIRTPSVVQSLYDAEARKVFLEEALAKPASTPVRLHPGLADKYREIVANLHVALSDPELRIEAIEIIRSLIESIILHRTDNGPEIELVGDLAVMVEVALSTGSESKKAALVRAALSVTEKSSVRVVAGAGFEPTTFRL
jgi:site-specific DNA recombinase